MVKYVAFLRAINVGGKNLIKMDELKKIFVSVASKNVTTYIQSGNVMFESSNLDENVLVKQIETRLHKKLSDDVLVFIRSFEKMKSIVEDDPFQKLKCKVPTKLYISFLKDRIKQNLKLPYHSPKKDVEIIHIDSNDVYCITQENNGQYGFPNLFIEKEFKVKATTRNWNTIIKVVDLLQ